MAEITQVERRLPQAMRPSGKTGRVFGWLMEWLNRPAYRWAVAQLKPVNPKSYLEIGFGTGSLLKLAIKKLKLAKVCGLDPSELMVATARSKLKRYEARLHVDVRQGDDTSIPWDGPFDAIAAVHSFQFRTHPSTSLIHIRALLVPQGRFVLVLRRHDGKKPPQWLPNPLSRGGDEVSETCKAAEAAGFAILAIQAISKGSTGIVLGCG